jgi:hypothetical protein
MCLLCGRLCTYCFCWTEPKIPFETTGIDPLGANMLLDEFSTVFGT